MSASPDSLTRMREYRAVLAFVIHPSRSAMPPEPSPDEENPAEAGFSHRPGSVFGSAACAAFYLRHDLRDEVTLLLLDADPHLEALERRHARPRAFQQLLDRH